MKNHFIIPIIAIALILQWYSHSSGLLLTADSYHYISGSESFKHSRSLIDGDGHNFLFWPPLFPIILSLLGPCGEGLIWINIFLEVCIALVVLSIVNRIIQHSGIRLLYFISILLGVHILLISSFLWSELIFLFLAVIFVDQLQKSRKNRTSFYLAIVSGFLMCLQRNAGLFIALGATIWIFIDEENRRQAILKSSVFFLCVNSGLLLWNGYVWFLAPHGHFDFSGKLFQYTVQNSNSIAHAVVNTFLPIHVFSIPILISAFISLTVFLKTELKRDRSLQLIFIITIVYLICLTLVVSTNIDGFLVDEGEGDRFISVIVPFLSLLLFKALEKIYDRQASVSRIVMMMLIGCWLIYPLARTIRNAKQWHDVSTSKRL